jgi:hypothetical protein
MAVPSSGPVIAQMSAELLKHRLRQLKQRTEAQQLAWLAEHCGVTVRAVSEIRQWDLENKIWPKVCEAETVPWQL